MYLLENSPIPDHSTFARFKSLHFAPCAERILAKKTVSDFSNTVIMYSWISLVEANQGMQNPPIH